MTVPEMARALRLRRSGKGWVGYCPVHEADGRRHRPSFSLDEGPDGKPLYYCHGTCSQADVGTKLRDLGLLSDSEKPITPIPASRQRKKHPEELGPIVAEYIYRDEHYSAAFRVTKHEPKDFRQWRPDGKGGWRRGLRNTRRIPYKLPELLESPIVFVVEGEKDCETLAEWGFCATCNPGGAEKWLPEFAEYFRGRTVILIPDCDAAGTRHAKQVIANLKPVAAQIITIDLSDDGVKDISEWFDRGHSECELLHVIECAWRETEVS